MALNLAGMFVTDQVIPDAKFKEIAARLKEAWTSLQVLNQLTYLNQDKVCC
jgi:hypothetical protein